MTDLNQELIEMIEARWPAVRVWELQTTGHAGNVLCFPPRVASDEEKLVCVFWWDSRLVASVSYKIAHSINTELFSADLSDLSWPEKFDDFYQMVKARVAAPSP